MMNIRNLKSIFFLCLLMGITVLSCKKDDVDENKEIVGCTDPAADNYNASANKDNGSCAYQNRFVSQYNINVACDQSSALFSDAVLEIKPGISKNQIGFYITSSSTNIQFFGKVISKDSVVVDTLIPDFKADLKNIVPLATESKIIKVDLGIKSRFGLSKDIKAMEGPMKLKLISKDTIEYQGLKIPPITLDDNCNLKATKK